MLKKYKFKRIPKPEICCYGFGNFTEVICVIGFSILVKNHAPMHKTINVIIEIPDNIMCIHRMLEKSFEKFPVVNGVIFHSDQGWQYQHVYFRNTLSAHGIIQSMSRKRNCYDNCIMETSFGRLKNEMHYGYEKNYSSFEEFSKAVEEYIDYYNNKRIQEKQNGCLP